MNRYKESNSEWQFFTDVAKIAVGVFVGAMMAVFAYESILQWRTNQAASQITQDLKNIEHKQKLAEQQRLQQQKDQQDQQRKQQLDRERQHQQQELALKHKERAWASFYQPSQICRNDPSRGDCADQHIRARKAFEGQYKDN